MSSQRGNVSRTRTQKYKNKTAFKNDLHDKSDKIKQINSMTQEGLCSRCKDQIEWKIKYKKYKPLTQPATCTKCHQKSVKKAYHTLCQPCASEAQVCAKCNSKKEIVNQPGPSEKERLAEEQEACFELKQVSERKRRSLLRHIEKGETGQVAEAGSKLDDSISEESVEQDSIDEEDGTCDDPEES